MTGSHTIFVVLIAATSFKRTPSVIYARVPTIIKYINYRLNQGGWGGYPPNRPAGKISLFLPLWQLAQEEPQSQSH